MADNEGCAVSVTIPPLSPQHVSHFRENGNERPSYENILSSQGKSLADAAAENLNTAQKRK
jgi:hypothetical protein